MKKIIAFLVILSSISFVQAQFTVDASGKVGINNSSPLYYLDLNGTLRFNAWTDVIFDWDNGQCCGQPALYPETSWYFRLGTPTKKLGDIFATNIYCTSLTESSDEEIKENISPLENTIEKIMYINGVHYNLKAEYFEGLPENLINEYSNEIKIGFLAQNVEEYYPELISFDVETGIKSISYTRMTPILLEAIKEQQIQINNLTNLLDQLINEENLKKTEKNSTQSIDRTYLVNESKLLQNLPNPFNEMTTIKFTISPMAKSASILFFNMKGDLIKTYNRLTKLDHLVIKKAEFNPGMYMYSLIVDGHEIDTKKMILTN